MGPDLAFAFRGGAVGLGAVNRPVQPIRSRAVWSRSLSGWQSTSSTSGSLSPVLALVLAPMAARAWRSSSSGSRGEGEAVAGLVLGIVRDGVRVCG